MSFTLITTYLLLVSNIENIQIDNTSPQSCLLRIRKARAVLLRPDTTDSIVSSAQRSSTLPHL